MASKLSIIDCAVSFLGGGVLTASFCNNLFVSICGGVFAIGLVMVLKLVDDGKRKRHEKKDTEG